MERPSAVILGAGGMFGAMAASVLASDLPVLAVGRQDFAVEDGAAGLRQLLAKRPPGVIVNGIAMLAGAIRGADSASLRAALSVNADFPHLLAEVAGSLGWRVLHISTDAVFPRNCGVVDEAATPRPEDAYGHTKLLGEPQAANVLTLRCSIVGPMVGSASRGLWPWLQGQPEGATLTGFEDQYWSGCTTLQLARFCGQLADPDEFARLRAAGPVLHFAPNPTLTKAELLRHLATTLRPDLTVQSGSSGAPVCRILVSRYLAAEFGGDGTWPDIIAATQRQSCLLQG